MRIGIEGQRLFRVKKHGMDMVALELIRNLQQIDKENEYVIFVKPDDDSDCLSETTNFKIVELDGGFYPQWEQIALPKAAAKESCDILHCTSNTAPLRGNIPLVLTLHDIIYMESTNLKLITGGGTAYQRFGNLYRKYVVPRIIKKASAVITVSEFEKGRIGEFFKMDTERLHAVYNGVSDYFKPVEHQDDLDRVRKQYNLPDKYFFFLGNTVPKKNTPGTLSAFSKFRKETKLDIPLVMLDYDKEDLQKIANDIGDPDLVNHIYLTGYVVNTDLPAIYTMSELFLYPSFRESFGIPILEAQKCGVPVITANTSSMPEVSGDGSYLIDPYDIDQITSAMVELTSKENIRQDYIKKGLENSAKFSWRSMAENVLKLYEGVHTKNN
ncbi:MAG: glycosyltransferase family 4 protein [Bacteroidales bacterium]|nr:glycosyltransferase family 4 protein [Bacteroidales bacterium]